MGFKIYSQTFKNCINLINRITALFLKINKFIDFYSISKAVTICSLNSSITRTLIMMGFFKIAYHYLLSILNQFITASKTFLSIFLQDILTESCIKYSFLLIKEKFQIVCSLYLFYFTFKLSLNYQFLWYLKDFSFFFRENYLGGYRCIQQKQESIQ